jgi:hypothetical protein
VAKNFCGISKYGMALVGITSISYRLALASRDFNR